MAGPMPPLRIIVQPREFYRERYKREINRQQNRAQRFIHGERNEYNLVYPTVEIAQSWLQNPQLQYYIRLGIVTVLSEQVNVHCVHPYTIATEEDSTIPDTTTNSVYFKLSNLEMQTGRKSFHFCLQKLTHREIIDHGLLRIADSREYHRSNITDTSDAKKMIDFYQLSKSQLVFSLAAFESGRKTDFPVIYSVSTVYSHVITGTTTPANDNDACFRYTPQKGDCKGGDEIFMYIPQLDKRKKLTVCFDHPLLDQNTSVHQDFVDEKTISLTTPPCPVQLTRDNSTFSVPIVIRLNGTEIARVNFTYLSLTTCLICNSDSVFQDLARSTVRKRPLLDTQDEENGRAQLSNLLSNQTLSTSTPQFENKFLVLQNAMKSGNSNAAFQLIENTNSFLEQINAQGDTPLLLAAKFNLTELIEKILQKGSKLIKQTDKLGNNIFHILARLRNDAAKTTIEHILLKLDKRTKDYLLQQINNEKHTPQQVAKIHNNPLCFSLLS